MAAVLATRFPSKAPELFAYQATITRAERNYEGKRWVAYDRHYRREALARKDQCRTPACTTRPSRAGLSPSPIAHFLWGMTTRWLSAQTTQTARSLATTRIQLLGPIRSQQCSRPMSRAEHRAHPLRYAGYSMRTAAGSRGACLRRLPWSP
jgi:hypothetical protein